MLLTVLEQKTMISFKWQTNYKTKQQNNWLFIKITNAQIWECKPKTESQKRLQNTISLFKKKKKNVIGEIKIGYAFKKENSYF